MRRGYRQLDHRGTASAADLVAMSNVQGTRRDVWFLDLMASRRCRIEGLVTQQWRFVVHCQC